MLQFQPKVKNYTLYSHKSLVILDFTLFYYYYYFKDNFDEIYCNFGNTKNMVEFKFYTEVLVKGSTREPTQIEKNKVLWSSL